MSLPPREDSLLPAKVSSQITVSSARVERAMRELAPLIKRADEIQAHNPLMAYYCAFAPAHLHASRRPTPNARRARARSRRAPATAVVVQVWRAVLVLGFSAVRRRCQRC